MSYHSRQPSIASSLLSSSTFNQSSNINRIGPWKLGKTLGQGSTGRVLLAEHSSNGQKAAVKVVSKSILMNSLELQQEDVQKGRDAAGLAYGIEREIIIMKLLNHPNVLRLYDVWETSKSLYLILEYVEGGELFDLLVEKGPLEEFEAVKFFRQIVMGASYCHALGICHRDLKPENLLLDHDLNVKLADFGMAALENNDRLLETSCGSPHYAAPEIVSGKHYHGFESDVWSCGVILFALLTGRLPFDDENIRNLLLKVQNGQFEMPLDISIEAQDLISKMLEVDPEKRIKTHLVLEHPLLLKYSISDKDAKTLHELPLPNTYLNNLKSVKEIDEQILSNLITLYHGRSKEEIISNLLKQESTTEKTFYFLLLRYRHNQSNSSLIRSLSIAKSINTNTNNHHYHHQIQQSSSLSSSSSSNQLIKTPKKSNRRSIISASSSHRKSVSFQKNSSPPAFKKSPSRRSIGYYNEPPSAQPPIPKNLYNDFQQQTQQRESKITPPRSSSRVSISKSVSKNNLKRRSRKSLLYSNKRNSITSKLINVYAKLANDNDWNVIDKEAKRTSSDFATLCDEIFDHEEREGIRKEEERIEAERLAKLEAERLAKEEAERLVREEEARIAKAKREAELAAKALRESEQDLIEIDDDVVEEPKISSSKRRSVSNPNKRASQLLNTDEISKIQQRATTNPFQTRPKSKLDPGLNYSSDKRQSKVYYEEDDLVTQAIRRSKFLGSRFDLNIKRHSTVANNEKSKQIMNEFNDEKRSSKIITTSVKDDYNGPKTLSEVKIPQVTRKSKLYSSSNKRLSVLSIYSTKYSYTDLASKLKDLNDEVDDDNDNHGLLDTPKQRRQSTVPKRSSMLQSSQPQQQISMIPEESSTSASYSKSSGLRLSYADRLSALRDPVEKAATNVHGQDQNDNKLELPELPDHYQPLKTSSNGNAASTSAPKTKTKAQSQKKQPVKIYQDEEDVENSESKTLPKPSKKEKVVAKNNSVSTTKITPLSDSTNRKSSGNFFSRKFSGSDRKTSTSTTTSNKSNASNTSSGNGFFSFFNSSGFVEGKTLNTIYEPNEMYQTLKRLLTSWNDYGLRNIETNDQLMEIQGNISKNNIFGLGSSRFKIQIGKYGKKGSLIKFTKLNGNKKGFKMLETEIERILNRENVLAFAT